ncbi:MAG TPA: long-chain fatty acid--CoA ligase [Rhodospirillales bacterium]|nr:long-chain fatty acid--CoA ligase [Rhodospirillales bacterium]
MSAQAWPNLATMFFEQAERLGGKPFLWAKRDGAYAPLSWRQAADKIRALAHGLHKLGVGQGDRVILVSENRPEWLIADVAVMALGAVTVPAYATNTEDDHQYILENSGAMGAIISTRRLAGRFLPAAHRSAAAKFVIAMEAPELSQQLSVDILNWDDALSEKAEDLELPPLTRADTSCIMYTSGTGGAPKGVMLSHGAILHNCAGARDALEELGLGDETFLSFLPLSHSYEHSAGQFFPISIGAQIYYAEGVETLAKNMAEARPTIMTAVPRLYESLHGRIMHGVKMAGGAKEKMFFKALELGKMRYHGAPLSLGQRLQDMALEKLVRAKVRKRFGGRLKALVSGGAPLNPDIGLFFIALGLRILQGYGLTESGPVVSVNRSHNARVDAVGPPLAGVEVKIADDGEILVRGELLMQGYWRNEAATNESLRGGWLYTGDIGHIDADGSLRITDRKKDIIVNSGGDNISPQRVEGILTLEPEIAQAMVYGDRRSHLAGLLVPDQDWMRQWARGNGKTGNISGDEDFRKALAQVVDRVNESLSSIEKVRRFIIAGDSFTIDNALMTPTMKIRRHKIMDVYGGRLAALYKNANTHK